MRLKTMYRILKIERYFRLFIYKSGWIVKKIIFIKNKIKWKFRKRNTMINPQCKSCSYYKMDTKNHNPNSCINILWCDYYKKYQRKMDKKFPMKKIIRQYN